VRGQKHTDAFPGTIIHPARDTGTVEVPVNRAAKKLDVRSYGDRMDRMESRR
jgi:hypothetical protein